MNRKPKRLLALSLFAASALAVGNAHAAVITLSDASSDATPASVLDATLDFVVIGGNTLQLTVTNDTTAPNEFNINEVFWNASSGVSSLNLTSATHSSAGDVFSAWTPVETPTTPTGLFGTFQFSLTDGVGETNPSVIQPANDVVFLMDITGSCADTLSCTDIDFVVPNSNGYVAAAKFVNGPGDDSAFGAAVPIPAAVWLFGSGLLVLMGISKRKTT